MIERAKTLLSSFSLRRMHRSHVIAVGIGVAILLWFGSGLLGGAEDPESTLTAAEVETANATLMRVRVVESVAEKRQGSLTIRGRTSAKRAVQVRAETSGSVAQLPVEKGARVSKGELICQLDIDARDAQMTEAKAVMRQRRLEYDASRKLAEKGYRAPTVAAESKAAYDAAQARLKQMQVELDQTHILAPFDGVLDHRPVEVGDYMRPGDICGMVVELDPLLVIGQISEDRVGSISIGEPGTARLVTGETTEGTISYVAKTADEATRTFLVELQVPNPDFAMRAGVTASLIVPGETVLAHRIPSSVISLDDKGVIGVRTVNKDNRVKFNTVELIDDTPEGLWVGGLPQKITLITVGQDYVKEGQRVEAIRAGDEGTAP